MRRRNWGVLGVAALVAGLLGFLVAKNHFLPEPSTHFEEAPLSNATIVRSGTFMGAGDGVHHVSGTIQVVRADDAYFLSFATYEQTQGPDVFVYLTDAATPSGKGTVETGLRILLDGGADGGESTKEGDFHQRLPSDFDPNRYHGVAVWCDRFDTLFGRATLSSS